MSATQTTGSYVVVVHPACTCLNPDDARHRAKCASWDVTERQATTLDQAQPLAIEAMKAGGLVEGTAAWTRALLTLLGGPEGGDIDAPDGRTIRVERVGAAPEESR